VPVHDVLARGAGGELVQPGGHGRGQQRTPHPRQVHLGISGREVTEGGADLAVAEDILHRGAVPVPVLRGHRPGRAGHVQAGQDEGVGIDGGLLRQLGKRQGPLVRVQRPAAP
jgi:hypothetical protein